VAKEWYNIDGILAHHNCDLWRKAEPAGDGMDYCGSFSFWNGAFSWMLSAVFEKYEKQEDVEFLKSIHPLLLKASNAWLELSVEDEEGRRFVCPATSPENSFFIDGKRLSVTKTAAMSNAIARDILRKTLVSCEILGDEENHKKYKALLDSFMPDRITDSGRIMEWGEDLEEAEPKHRHVSHLFALHPGNEITPEKTPELCRACEKSLEVRGDDGTGWCIAWKANMWARLEKGERARKLLDTQLRLCTDKNTIYTKGGGTYPNMLCAHPPFQIDGNFGATAAIREMLARNEGKRIYILPALPKAWENGEIKGIRLNGNAILNLPWKDGKAQKIEILPKEKAENYEIIK
jgi:alpha-L-fucosidase 2